MFRHIGYNLGSQVYLYKRVRILTRAQPATRSNPRNKKSSTSSKSSRKAAAIRGPGRPRASGQASNDTREDILVAAAKLFSTKGVAGTRVADIAHEVGVRPPSIYYHFKDLEAILRELLNFAVFDATPFVSDEYGTPAGQLSSLIVEQISRLNESGIDIWFVTETAQLSSYHFPEVVRKVTSWRKCIGDIYEAGVKSGDFIRMDHDVAVASISGLTYGAYRHVHGGGTIEPKVLADICVRSLGGQPVEVATQ